MQYIDKKNGTFTCLVADDSRFSRQNISGVVRRLGGSVVAEAANGVEAVERYSSLRPDLVLLDITMPELDGIGTLTKILEMDKNARVIIVSSLGSKDMVWKAVSLGAKSFIVKPFTEDYAALVIGDAVADRKDATQ